MKEDLKIARRGDEPLKWQFDIVNGANGVAELQTTCSRGSLSLKFTTLFDQTASEGQPRLRKTLELVAEELRAQLEEAGCNTDRHFIWIRFGEGVWEPDDHPPDPEDSETRSFQLRGWYDHLCASVTAESPNRLKGELLNIITLLLMRNLEDGMLEDLTNVVTAHRGMSLVGNVNEMAALGLRTRASLARGPEAHSRGSQKKLEIVCKYAAKYWNDKAALSGDQSNTAAVIATDVNSELEMLALGNIRPKTIATYIALGMAKGLLPKRGRLSSNASRFLPLGTNPT